jgi:hypothetical protein
VSDLDKLEARAREWAPASRVALRSILASDKAKGEAWGGQALLDLRHSDVVQDGAMLIVRAVLTDGREGSRAILPHTLPEPPYHVAKIEPLVSDALREAVAEAREQAAA